MSRVFTSICVCVILCNFTTCIDSCNHNHDRSCPVLKFFIARQSSDSHLWNYEYQEKSTKQNVLNVQCHSLTTKSEVNIKLWRPVGFHCTRSLCLIQKQFFNMWGPKDNDIRQKKEQRNDRGKKSPLWSENKLKKKKSLCCSLHFQSNHTMKQVLLVGKGHSMSSSKTPIVYRAAVFDAIRGLVSVWNLIEWFIN